MLLKRGAEAPYHPCLGLINNESAAPDGQGCKAPLRGYGLDNPAQAD
jgi:hypothetical protein